MKKETVILPQNTRWMGAFLGFIGGALDVFCHMHYHTLVATQTGNILLLVSDWGYPNLDNTVVRCASILFFSLGFLFGLKLKDFRKTAHWRTKSLLPLLVVTVLLPFFSARTSWEVPFIAFGTGMMMQTFTGSLIENHPYMIFMTSGNYRKMLLALYRVWDGKGDTQEYKRQAINYGIVVGSFIMGAILQAFLMTTFKVWSVWLISLNLLVIIAYYTYQVMKQELQVSNL